MSGVVVVRMAVLGGESGSVLFTPLMSVSIMLHHRRLCLGRSSNTKNETLGNNEDINGIINLKASPPQAPTRASEERVQEEENGGEGEYSF